jgi:hypothetical protein
MYVDNNLVMSDAQAVTASTASTKSIDCATALRDIGGGEAVELVVVITTTVAATGGASTTTFSLQDSSDNSSFSTVTSSADISKASLTAGTEVLRIHLPRGLRRYIQVYYTVSTNNWTSGAVSAFLTIDRQSNLARPSGFTV